MVVVSSAFESASREDLLAVIGLLQRQVEAAEEQAAELAAANERLTVRVAELERRLGRNSSNSSMPPSSDVFGRPEKKAAPKSGRTRGRQSGTGGSGLSMIADPDVVEEHLPAACSGCGSGLGPGDSVGFERRQVRDIPLTTVTVTEHKGEDLSTPTRLVASRLLAGLHPDVRRGVAVTDAVTSGGCGVCW
ncbi:DUF6444 domain-containing protein [Streptomyces sp. NBC_01614]|uniref:DUF6444 domain-containing protein n=1 Tax=Streptomyces sp. NBC_01614 TaxID=2975897 RepID=UPI003865C3E6